MQLAPTLLFFLDSFTHFDSFLTFDSYNKKQLMRKKSMARSIYESEAFLEEVTLQIEFFYAEGMGGKIGGNEQERYC